MLLLLTVIMGMLEAVEVWLGKLGIVARASGFEDRGMQGRQRFRWIRLLGSEENYWYYKSAVV